MNLFDNIVLAEVNNLPNRKRLSLRQNRKRPIQTPTDTGTEEKSQSAYDKFKAIEKIMNRYNLTFHDAKAIHAEIIKQQIAALKKKTKMPRAWCVMRIANGRFHHKEPEGGWSDK